MNAISEAELDQRLAAADPVDRAALARLDMALTAPQLAGAVAAPPVAGPRRQLRRVLTVAVALTAVAAAALMGAEVFGSDNGGGAFPLAVPAAQAAQLRQLARASLSPAPLDPLITGVQPANAAYGVVAPARLAYQLTSEVDVSGVASWPFGHPQQVVRYRYDTVIDQTLHVSPSAPARTIDGGRTSRRATITGLTDWDRRVLATHFAGPGGLPYPPVLGTFAATGQSDLFSARGAVGPAQMLRLPASADGLLARLRTDYLHPTGSPRPHSQDAALWEGLKSILEQAVAPGVRASAFQALARVPGVTVRGPAIDARRRPGVAISFSGDPASRDEIIVDRGSGELLQRTLTAVRDFRGWPAGTQVTREVWLGRSLIYTNPVLTGPAGGTPRRR